MSDWLVRYARALAEEPLSREEIATLLDLARDVAHGTERRFAPLSTFLAGVRVGRQLTGVGGERATALEQAVAAAHRVLDSP